MSGSTQPVGAPVAFSPTVADALGDIELEFPDGVTAVADGAGGAYVTVEPIAIGDSWSRQSAPVSFHLPYNYPAAAPYPYFIPSDLLPEQAPLPPGLQRVVWQDKPMLQVSLRHNRWDPERDRILGCLLQVADWLRRQ